MTTKRNRKGILIVSTTWTIAIVGAGAAWAQPARNGHPPGPPPEALAACESLASGEDCSFESPYGTAIGTCWAPEGKALACRPTDAPPPRGSDQDRPQGPPPEALAACETLASGEDCSFESPHGTATGTCWAPEGMELACRPTDAPPPRDDQDRQ